MWNDKTYDANLVASVVIRHIDTATRNSRDSIRRMNRIVRDRSHPRQRARARAGVMDNLKDLHGSIRARTCLVRKDLACGGIEGGPEIGDVQQVGSVEFPITTGEANDVEETISSGPGEARHGDLLKIQRVQVQRYDSVPGGPACEVELRLTAILPLGTQYHKYIKIKRDMHTWASSFPGLGGRSMRGRASLSWRMSTCPHKPPAGDHEADDIGVESRLVA